MASSPAKTRRKKKSRKLGFWKTIGIGATIGLGNLGTSIHNRLFPGLKHHPGNRHHKENVEYYKTILEDGAAAGGMAAGTGGFGGDAAATGPVAGVDKFLGKPPKSKAADTIEQPEDEAKREALVHEAYIRIILERKGKGKSSADVRAGVAKKVASPPYHNVVEQKLLKKSIVTPVEIEDKKADFTKIQNGDGRQI